VAFVGVLSGGINEPIFAQVTPDDTLGVESSVVTPDVLIREILSDKIDGGAIRGANLFHSFSEFNVGEGRGVYFANPDGIENILSRVTGGDASQILGRLGVLGDANLFLLNPNGILFGASASLDIQGSFVASTASGIELGEDGYFSATQPQSSRLLAVSPGALFYNAVAASGGSITNVGNLAVGQGEFLTLAGGTVTSTGSLTAPGGTIQVLGERVGLLENARIDVSSQTGGGTVLIGGGFQGQGNIPKAERTFVGSGVTINADAFKSGNGGNVIIWADEVTGFYGNISARGGIEAGNGGFVEVSGKEHLIFRGTVDTSAVNGLWGTLLLDPTNIVIANGSRDSGKDGRNTFAGNNSGVAGSILSAPLSSINDTAPTTIYESELEGLAGNTNVILQATNNITVNNLADNALTFAPGSGGIAFTADADGNGVGAFVMRDVADTLYTNGRDIVISGASLTLGDINTFEWGKLIATVNVDAGGRIPRRGTATFTFTVPDLGQPVGNLDVRFSARHTRNRDLNVFLTSPRGTKLELFTGVGGSGDNFQDTLLDDEARTIMLANSRGAPFNGTFKPEGAGGLAVFQGENPMGTWKLSVTDDQQGDSGRLFRVGNNAPWGRAIGTQLLFRTPTTRVSGSIHLNATNGSISVGNLNTSNEFNAGGAIRLDASDSITTGIIESSSSVNGGMISLRAGGDITTNGFLDSSSRSGSGGAITLRADGDITTNRFLKSSSRSGNGGAITLSSVSGNITTNGYLSSDSLFGNGGGISLSSVSGNITTNGYLSSDSSGNGGAITLSSVSGDITTNGFLDSSSISGNGRAITLSSISGDITTNGYLSSDSSSGNGGAITLSSISGDITTNGFLNSDSSSGNGGAITLSSDSGDITINGDLNSFSHSRLGNIGNGGAISLYSISGDITIKGDLRSFSHSRLGNAGNGGAISLIATGGNIIGNYPNSLLASFSISEKGGEAGSGGNVTLEAQNQITNLEILTLSSSAQAGEVEIKGSGDLSVTNTRILTSRRVEVKDLIANNRIITLEVGGQGQSGDVTVTSLGNLTFNNSSIQSDTNGSKNAGNVRITSPGLVTFNNSQIISNTSNIGKAGDIDINAGRGITFQGLYSYQNQPQRGGLFAGTTNQGFAGTITLTTPELTLQNGANIATTTASSANAGNITLQSHPNGQNLNINLAQDTSISASTSNQGTGGNIKINAPNAITIQGQGTLSTETQGTGNAGDIEITSRNLDIQQTQLSTSTAGTGNAGNITLDTSTLTVARGAEIFAFTNGSGNSGTITVNAPTAVNLGIGVDDFSPVLSVETSNGGKAGNIIINTPSLTLSDTARITATATNTATNTEGGGSISLNASDMHLAGVVGVFAETQGLSRAGTLTLKPYQDQSTLNLTLAPQSQVSASTSGSGKGGNLIVTAPEAITIRGQGQLAVQTTGDGAAGDLRIDTQRLTIADGATISASTSSPNRDGAGGNITINATESFNLTNQASLLAQSTGAGRAGDVKINTPQLNLLDQAQVSVETSGAGVAGDVEITTETLTLDRGAKVSATAANTATTSAQGGNVNVNASQINLSGNTSGLFAQTQGAAPAGSLILQPYNNGQSLTVNLKDNPQISASTSGSGKGGNLSVTAPEAVTLRGLGQFSVETTGAGAAGNLTIDTQRLNISDSASISASTSSPNPAGVGGNLTINATQSFNLTNQASLLAQSTGAGRAGDVKINTPQLNLLDQAQVSVETSGAGVAGDVEITTETLTLDRGAKVSATAANTATTSAQGGNVNVNASQINLSGNTSGLFAQTQGAAPAGSLILQPYNNGQSLTVNLKDNPQISASTSGSGTGGNLSVTAPEAVTIRGNGKLSVETTGAGAAGNLTIDTQRLNISDSASISASTSSPNPAGVGGNLTINATQSFNLTNQASLLAQSNGAAKAGNVTINTEQLTANNGSITTSATATSRGEGGSIDVNASEINLKGTEIGLLAETQGVAPAGSLTLQPFNNGRNLTINLQDNAKISAATSGSGQGGSLRVTAPEYITIRGQGQLSVETTGDGAAGNLTIDTQKLTITDGATISASTSSQNPAGVGGNLTINATESFNLTNLAGLLAESTGAAPAGNITVETGQLTAHNGSIETSATQSAGGGITITASDVRLFGDSDIRTDVAKGAGGGGNISLTANTIIAFADSDILAYAADGRGGDITFKTPIFFGFAYSPAPKGTDPDTLDHNNRVDINASGAVEGVISLPDLSFIENSLTQLPNNSIDTESLIANSCIARRYEQQRGSFIITGTGGIPFRPGDAYVMRYQTGTVRSIPNEGDGGETSVARVRAPASLSASQSSPTPQQLASTTRRLWKMGDPIIEPTGIYRLPNGELIMSRECPQ
jgi:filamentous hemagglutinin family protein